MTLTERIIYALKHRADPTANPHKIALARADFYQFMFWLTNGCWIAFFTSLTASVMGARE